MNKNTTSPGDAPKPTHFIRQIIERDIEEGRNDGRVVTRFPPEPNGYPHIGHAKAICLNFGVATDFGGCCHLRFDDTNPEKESLEFVEAFKRDIQWLGFDWGEHEYYASDYFEQLYEFALELIRRGKAYVCDLGVEEFKEFRGVPTRPGRESPSRGRSSEESEDLFRKMRAGEFEDGAFVLRARIDMASPNLHMRDPALYRIKRSTHYRTADAWCIYPTYDFAHGLSDAIEHVTHSLCTIEFEVHRPLYDWILEQLDFSEPPRQYEFAPLNLSYTALSKRLYEPLIQDGVISGWDDPRMPTLSGLRRRGYTPEAIRALCVEVGVTKYESTTDISLLEHFLRQDLNKRVPRVMGVLQPLKIVLTNYPEGAEEELDAVNNPEDLDAGTRKVPFSRELYIERDDFLEDPPKKFFRLGPGREVRLRYAYFVTCDEVVKDTDGNVVELRCRYDPETRGGDAPDGRKVKGTLHWVSVPHALKAEIRLYDRLFADEEPFGDKERSLSDILNPDSLEIVTGYVEPSVADAKPGSRYQFERQGYFCVDSQDSTPQGMVFNRTVTLRDTWAKISGGGKSR